MKNIMKRCLLLLLLLITITACDSRVNQEEEKKEENKMEKIKQDLTILEQTEDGEITKGTLEGYTFVETEEKTDRVKIQMEDGSIILLVLSNKDTPITIEHFKELVASKYYDGLIFHRVIKDFMIQGGDITGTGYGSGEEEHIKGEFQSNGVNNTLSHTRGVISMARATAPDTAGTQFFIVHKDSTFLDGNYAAFGKVFAGMDEVDAIAEVETGANDRPVVDQKMKSIRFITIEKA